MGGRFWEPLTPRQRQFGPQSPVGALAERTATPPPPQYSAARSVTIDSRARAGLDSSAADHASADLEAIGLRTGTPASSFAMIRRVGPPTGSGSSAASPKPDERTCDAAHCRRCRPRLPTLSSMSWRSAKFRQRIRPKLDGDCRGRGGLSHASARQRIDGGGRPRCSADDGRYHRAAMRARSR